MVELIYVGDTVTVNTNADIPFNQAIGCGCNERYEGNTNTLTLLRPGRYLVTARANVGLPADGTVGEEVSITITANGANVAGATGTDTPGVVSRVHSVSAQTVLTVYPGCCKSVGLRATGDPMIVNNQNLIAVRIGGCYA